MITEKVLKVLKENNVAGEDCKILVGVSGGADSVCLLCVIKEVLKGASITALHLHHGIRGKEADRDAKFTEELCKKLGVEFVLVKKDIPALAKEKGLSEEEMGRIARYEEFEKCAKERDIRYIAVAHNMEDCAETFIHNLCRGTGLAGLTGIAAVNGNIIRPLIEVSRKEIEEYLKERGQDYVTDSTNLTDEYTRNKIRNSVLPELKEINDRAAQHIAAAGRSLYDIKRYIDLQSAAEFKKLTKDDKGFTWKKEDFDNCHEALRPEVLLSAFKEASGRVKDFTGEHIRSVCELFYNQVGRKINLPYGLLAERVYAGVRIGMEVKDEIAGFEYEAQIPSVVYVPELKVTVKFDVKDLTEPVKEVKNKEIIINNGAIIKIPESGCIKWFDCDKITNAISVRTIKEGDRIALFTGGGGKKLKSFYTDIKLPREERNRTLLVASGSDILYVYGQRDSADYRIEKGTKKILMVEIISNGG
ncbi:MAG: tRNA lysidine(34) synthetase TilS [Lachnospiraceae bacterium]|nr:tRNA lysidine(34) synthetase TilS [Lachnospiraceae bacterium]